jgi:hypothetical protein
VRQVLVSNDNPPDMRKTIKFFLFLLFIQSVAIGQNVSVSGALVGNGGYATLTDAFTAINAGAQTGATITISILANTNEGNGTAVLNAGAWTSISIVPVGQPRSITGSTTPGQPMIHLNGADHVSFSGFLGGQKGLTLFNTTNSTTVGTSTIRFSDAAQNNSISYCKVWGASVTPNNSEGGSIVFVAGGSGGSSNNSINNSELGAGNADLPNKAIFSLGSSTMADMNANNYVVACHFYDCFSATQTSSAILLLGGTSQWTIHNNRFYQNAPRTKTNNSVHNDIRIEGKPGNTFHQVTNNTCGTHPTAMPAYSQFEFLATSAAYNPIYVGSVSLLGNIVISNNLIQDIQIQVPPMSGSSAVFMGIYIGGSECYVAGNLVGSTTIPNSIVINSGFSGQTGVSAIRGGVGDDQIYEYNQVGGIQVNSVGGGSSSFTGIGMYGMNALCVIDHNTIGYASAPIQLHGTAPNGGMRGISAGAGGMTMTNNTVAYLYNDQPSAATSGVYMNTGIYAESGSLIMGFLARNTVHTIVASHPTSATGLAGIQSYNCASVDNNLVHSLTLGTQSPAAMLVGIDLMLGNPQVVNNMVRLGYTDMGTPMTGGIQIYGIHNKIGRPWVDYNSIYIGGSGVTGTADTYAMYSQGGHPNVRFLNNIFYNARSNSSGSGKHYAISHGGSPLFPPMPVSNGNDLLADGVGGHVGRLDGIDLVDILAWRLYANQDFNSISHDPNFLNPTGNAAAGDLHIGPISPIEGIGVAGSFLTVDIDNQDRGTLTPRDAGADAGNFTPLVVQQPEAHLMGNAVPIADGDITPATNDGTDFGAGSGCTANSSRTFVLRNIGNANLNVTGITVSGSSNFTVMSPTTGSVLPGGTFNIVVQYTPFTAGTTTATISVSCNDTDEGTYTFDVQATSLADTIAPVAICQSINAPIAANGVAAVNAAAFGAGSTDNCAIVTYTASPAQFTCAQAGSQAVTLTVADAAGQTATCLGSVNVVDQLAPQALCQNISLSLGAGGTAPLTPAALDGGSSDNCAIDSVWASVTAFTCAQIGPNAVQLHVRDAAGNVGTCSATVTVLESQAPTALCQPATLQLNAAGQALLPPVLIDAGSSDNCGIASRVPSQALFTCADVGVRPVMLTVTDGAGNTASCSTQVTVVDAIAPVLTCANVTLTVPSSGPAFLTPAMVGTATDACGIASYTLSQTQFSCPNLGTSPVALIAVDVNGNRDTCIVVLTTLAAPLAAAITAPVGPCGHHIACAGQTSASATVSATGACAPYTYTWSNGQTGATVTGLGAGTYSVTVQASGGQQSVQNITLTAPPPLSLSLSSAPSCVGSQTGSITAVASGGQSCQPYNYLWSNGAASANLSGLAPGSYTLTLTDAQGCSSQASATVSTWPTPTLTITQNQGNLIATSGFVSYQWYVGSMIIPGATGMQFTPLVTGLFHVVAIDSNGCEWVSADFPFTFVGNAAVLPGWETVTLYPNPSPGVFRFAVGQAIDGPIWLSVTDLSGKVLLREALTVLENGRAFDLSGVAAGVYLVELRTEDGVQGRFRWLRE